VAGLDDPATGSPSGGVGLELDLLATRSDVGGVAVLDGDVVDRRRVIAAVEAQPLRPLGGGLGSLDGDALKRRL